MISLNLTNVKDFMSHLLLSETFDNFYFIEGEIVTFNTFTIDGYIQKDFFDSDAELTEYSYWKNLLFPDPGKAHPLKLPPRVQSLPGEHGAHCQKVHPLPQPG